MIDASTEIILMCIFSFHTSLKFGAGFESSDSIYKSSSLAMYFAANPF